ncbi:caspase family protein [Prosthecodimorpha staleyi]|uniref:Caspase family protein n=1 Tax=Prosthecodimorpha staleyi TaxID=2840188 RepID=A0A947D789_9HYPH|nr:caspase family protein [Prosthecodimorpha staleyi]MBT9288119.1 caspase family protein [Prosthecodimorpha staleyi]
MPLPRLLVALAVAVAVLLLPVDVQAAANRIALIIGNGAYADGRDLRNPPNDAADLGATLGAAGFEVEIRQDLTRQQMLAALQDFEDKAVGAEAAIVFFAGHGFEYGGTNWLVPVDAKVKRESRIADETIPLDRVRQALEPARGLKLVILDACRDNPFRAGLGTLTRATTARGLARVETSGREAIAYAARDRTTAEDGTGRNSPFTAALIRHIVTPGLDVRFLFGAVADEVRVATAGRQEPFLYQSFGRAPVHIVQPIPVAAAPAPLPVAVAPPPVVSAERNDFDLAERVGTIGAWQAFVDLHKEGFLVRLTQERIETLKAKQAAVALPAVGADAKPTAGAPSSGVEVVNPLLPQTKAPAGPISAPGAGGSAPDLIETGRAVRRELQRLACAPGPVEGEWTSAATEALARFGRAAKMRVAVADINAGLLEQMRRYDDNLCKPKPVCGPGETLKGGACVVLELTCPKGTRRTASGICEAENPTKLEAMKTKPAPIVVDILESPCGPGETLKGGTCVALELVCPKGTRRTASGICETENPTKLEAKKTKPAPIVVDIPASVCRPGETPKGKTCVKTKPSPFEVDF